MTWLHRKMEFEGNRTELEFVIFLILNSLSFSYISIYKLLIFKKILVIKYTNMHLILESFSILSTYEEFKKLCWLFSFHSIFSPQKHLRKSLWNQMSLQWKCSYLQWSDRVDYILPVSPCMYLCWDLHHELQI